MKVNILAIGVHPDDVELACSGTLLKHIAMGKKVGLLDLTQGELGTRGSGPLRLVEAGESAKLMGAAWRQNLGMADGFFQYSEENILKIIPVIRAAQPEIILANSLSDRHPDHGRAAKLVADACFYSGLVKIETFDQRGGKQDRWRPKALYHYIQDRISKPDFVVDITDHMDKKFELILAFKSQFFIEDQVDTELSTPISGADFQAYLRAVARVHGRPAGMEYAEAFQVSRTLGVQSLFDLV
ncbi:MAG: bacillithiol biosynthesis deacetylase BshB1 [Bacteroidota bacterium]